MRPKAVNLPVVHTHTYDGRLLRCPLYKQDLCPQSIHPKLFFKILSIKCVNPATSSSIGLLPPSFEPHTPNPHPANSPPPFPTFLERQNQSRSLPVAILQCRERYMWPVGSARLPALARFRASDHLKGSSGPGEGVGKEFGGGAPELANRVRDMVHKTTGVSPYRVRKEPACQHVQRPISSFNRVTISNV